MVQLMKNPTCAAGQAGEGERSKTGVTHTLKSRFESKKEPLPLWKEIL